jgi:hypothetical protein
MKYNWENVITFIVEKGYARDDVVAVLNSFVKFIKLRAWDKPIIIHEFLKFEVAEYQTAGKKLKHIDIKPIGHAWWFIGDYYNIYDIKYYIQKEKGYQLEMIGDILDGMIKFINFCFTVGGSSAKVILFKTKDMPAFLKLEAVGNKVVASPTDKKSEHSWAYSKDRDKIEKELQKD